ncbi:MAG: right-handed parallel beta-helix repeat-containing protein [Candidatus Heimdallarchaeaceae archaeon]|jgi:parallel beta-helix repeat protein
MKMKVKIISLIVIFSIFTMFLSSSYQSVHSILDKSTNDVELSALTPHGPIIITHDDNFSLYSLSGDGSPLTPYRIENLNITSITDDIAIQIYHTTKHFIIKNCYLRTVLYGIDIVDVDPYTAQIVDNTFEGIQTDHGNAIYVRSSNSTLIANNTFLYPVESSMAIYISYAHHTTVFNNTAIDVPVSPKLEFFWGYESDYVTVTNNTVTNVGRGIGMMYCPYATISNNTITNVWGGIEFHTCPDSEIDNNYIDSVGNMAIDMSYSASNITNNKVFHAGIRPGEVDNKEYRNYRVENNKVNNKDYGFFVDTPDLILDSGKYIQIFAYNCSDILIENFVSNEINQAISLIECSEPAISDSEFYDCVYTAIHFVGCTKPKATKCSFIDCESGIGIHRSNFANISNCIFYQQFFEAIMITESHNASITYNLFQNGNTGVFIDSSATNNSIHHNTFEYASGYDAGVNNTWYDPITQEGNYWWDYSGSGNYTVAGSARANDTYPLTTPPIPIIPEFGGNFKTTFLLLLIPIIFVIPYIRKRKK